jgi:hypothetical protein
VPLEQARLITSWVALSGQFYLNSDWLPELPAERLDIIKRTIPAHGAIARPVDYFDTAMPRIWLVTDTRQTCRRDVLGLFNWEDGEQAIGCKTSWAGLDPEKQYFAFDFWANTPAQPCSGEFAYSVPGRSCRVLALRAKEDHPVLVSTSRHVTQGILEVTDEKWDPRHRVLSANSQIIGGDLYELRIAGLEGAGKSWKPVISRVSPVDQHAGVRIEAKPISAAESGWLRVSIQSSRTRTVRCNGVKGSECSASAAAYC